MYDSLSPPFHTHRSGDLKIFLSTHACIHEREFHTFEVIEKACLRTMLEAVSQETCNCITSPLSMSHYMVPNDCHAHGNPYFRTLSVAKQVSKHRGLCLSVWHNDERMLLTSFQCDSNSSSMHGRWGGLACDHERRDHQSSHAEILRSVGPIAH